MRMSIKDTICTWATSLVVRVISDAVEKSPNSALEKLSTFLKMAERISRATAVEVRAAKKLTKMELITAIIETPIITVPILRM